MPISTGDFVTAAMWNAVVAGGMIPVANITARGALTPAVGMQIYRIDLKCVQTWNGSRWFTVDSFAGADAGMVVGAALTDWDTQKIRMDFHATVTTSAGGIASVVYPTAFPHGVTYCAANPGAITSNLGFLRPEPSFFTLSQWAGYCYTPAGVILGTGLSVSVAVQVVGW